MIGPCFYELTNDPFKCAFIYLFNLGTFSPACLQYTNLSDKFDKFQFTFHGNVRSSYLAASFKRKSSPVKTASHTLAFG